jgi:diguanylate cyclase (GGDEF)-like protein/PAS domain S-box-containing protein
LKTVQLNIPAFLENLQIGVVIHDKHTRILFANSRALALLRLTQEQALGTGAFDSQWQFLDKYEKPLSVADYPVNQVVASQRAIANVEVGITDSSTREITWVLCHAYPEFDDNKELMQIIVHFYDITSIKKNISFENIVEHANDVIIVTDADPSPKGGPRIVYVNQAFTDLTGYAKEEVAGKSPGILQGPETSEKTRQEISRSLHKRNSIQAQILNYTKSGESYWLDMNIFPLRGPDGEISFFAAIERDITQQKNYELKLKDLTIHDPLTSLLNRRGFFELAQSLLTQSMRNKSSLVVAMIDIDFFKRINDLYGHDIGDETLRHFSYLMQTYFRKSDVIARMGGEEFALVLTNTEIRACQEKFVTFLDYLSENPLILGPERSLTFTISVGLAQPRANSKTISDILKVADTALYQAKGQGRNKVVIQE